MLSVQDLGYAVFLGVDFRRPTVPRIVVFRHIRLNCDRETFDADCGYPADWWTFLLLLQCTGSIAS